MAVTKEQIAQAVTALRAENKPYGPTHIRAELGEGSLSTISKYRQEILDSEAKATQPADPVTEDVIEIVRDLLHNHAEGPKVKEVQAKLKDTEATAREMQKECERIEILLEEARSSLAKEQAAHTADQERYEARIAELQAELTATRGEVTRLQAAGQQHAQELAETERRHSGKVEALHASAEKLNNEIRTLSSELAAVKEQFKAAQSAAAEAAAVKDKALTSLATAEAAAKAAKQESADAVAVAKADAAEVAQQMRGEIAEWKAEVKAVREALREKDEALALASAEIADLRVRLARLEPREEATKQ